MKEFLTTAAKAVLFSPVPDKIAYTLALFSLIPTILLFYTIRGSAQTTPMYNIYIGSELLGLAAFFSKPFKIIPNWIIDTTLVLTGLLGLASKGAMSYRTYKEGNSNFLTASLYFGLPALFNLYGYRKGLIFATETFR